MIKNFKVSGLNGYLAKEINFFPDINVLTGKNGSGKTTILKLMWYMISGNIERILKEMFFDYVSIKTTEFSLSLEKIKPNSKKKVSDQSGDIYKMSYKLNKAGKQTAITALLSTLELTEEASAVRVANLALAKTGSSLFFPTFRRLEGGFSLTGRKGENQRRIPGSPRTEMDQDISRLSTTVDGLVEKLSIYDHRFVCSVSTIDIASLLTQKYAEISANTNSLHTNFAARITALINGMSVDAPQGKQLKSAKSIIASIKKLTEENSAQQTAFLAPFTTIAELTRTILKYNGIDFDKKITLGDSADIIQSNLLSAGEKQMLGFLVYNAFYQHIPVFIDEPEISLHVDWQRTLFPTLLKQGRDNQFIITTHSPFIYSKYKDREFILNDDLGNNIGH